MTKQLLRRSFSFFAISAALLGVTQAVQAEIFEIEGPIGQITCEPADCTGGGTVTVMGTTIQIPAGTPIHSPTADLNLAQLASTDAFEESGKLGFIGGTAIVTGTDNAVPGTPIAEDVFVELAENVLAGPVGANSGAALTIHGTEVVPIPGSETRMPFSGAVNQFGFSVDFTTIPVGDLTAAEGYYGVDNKLHVHTVETTGGTLLSNAIQVSIQRAQCVDNGNTIDVEIRGGVTIPNTLAPRQVRAFRLTANGSRGALLGNANNLAPDFEFPAFGAYRITRSGLSQATCPARVLVEYRKSDTNTVYATTIADMDIQ